MKMHCVLSLDYVDYLALISADLPRSQELHISLDRASNKVSLLLNMLKAEYIAINRSRTPPVIASNGNVPRSLLVKKTFLLERDNPRMYVTNFISSGYLASQRKQKSDSFVPVLSILLYGSETWTMNKPP